MKETDLVLVAQVQRLDLLFNGCVTSGKAHNLSEPQILHLRSGRHNSNLQSSYMQEVENYKNSTMLIILTDII